MTNQLASANPESRALIWRSVFATTLPSSVLLQLIRAVEDEVLPADFENVELDDLVLELLSSVLVAEGVNEVELEIITRLINRPGQYCIIFCSLKLILPLEPFVTLSSPLQLLALVTSRLEELTRQASSSSPALLHLFSSPTRILAHYVSIPANALIVAKSEISLGGIVATAEIAHLLPHARLGDLAEVVEVAESAWNAIVIAGGEDMVVAVLNKLRERVLDVESHPS